MTNCHLLEVVSEHFIKEVSLELDPEEATGPHESLVKLVLQLRLISAPRVTRAMPSLLESFDEETKHPEPTDEFTTVLKALAQVCNFIY